MKEIFEQYGGAIITVIATGIGENKQQSGKIVPNLKYQQPVAGAARPTAGTGFGAGVGTGYANRTTAGAGTMMNQTASRPVMQQQTQTSVPPTFSGIQRPKRPESTVPEKDIKIPEFLKSTRK